MTKKYEELEKDKEIFNDIKKDSDNNFLIIDDSPNIVRGDKDGNGKRYYTDIIEG